MPAPDMLLSPPGHGAHCAWDRDTLYQPVRDGKQAAAARVPDGGGAAVRG